MEAEEIKVIQPEFKVNDRVVGRGRRGHEVPCIPHEGYEYHPTGNRKALQSLSKRKA